MERKQRCSSRPSRPWAVKDLADCRPAAANPRRGKPHRKNMPRVIQSTAAPLVPANPTLETLRQAAAGCRACALWKLGTQTVFGEGRTGAPVMMVGEQPGDKEDLQGRPFVGPAGAVLD